MRRSIATVSLSGTLEEKLEAASWVGFDGVEIFESDLISSPLAPREIRALAQSLDLTLDLYQPFRDFEGVDDARLAANIRRAEAKFALMVELGVDTMLVCSNATESAIDDDARAASQLRLLAEAAEPYGVRVAYEALAWGRHVATYEHAWKLVAEADHPLLGLCLDSFHILSRGDDPAAIRDIPGEKLFFLQLADAPRMRMDVLQWSRHYRCFPGQGGFDLTTFTHHVLAAGYRGPLSLEVFNDVFRASDPDRTAADALRSLSVLEDSLAGEQETANLRHDRGSFTPITLTRLPEPVRPAGFGFVEIAATEPAAERAGAVLAALGFAHTRDHRSKPVQLWEHGNTRILLNAADPRLGHTWGSEATITALGIGLSDPERARERAERLSAPALARRRDPSEAALQSVAAPDGTAVFFCPTGPPDADSWLADFSAPAVTNAHEQRDTSIIDIDHIGLYQPFDHFDEASLFYRALLGLAPTEVSELASPDGLVRSRALSHPDTKSPLRIVLNVSLLGRGPQADADGGAQHIALSCDDIFSIAEDMVDAGVSPLRVPDNYYDDLAARTDLPPAQRERMRRLGILYDHDPQGGEFLHLYTPLLDGRLFFEVVQRVDGYQGYGAANTTIRMTAHREGSNT